MKLRAAIVGCGRIGSEFSDDARVKGIYSHAGAYAASAKADLVAVCDSDALRAERCAQRWGLESGFTDLTRMLATARPQIVSICSPDDTHARVLQEVLEHPGVRGVLAEKPLALDAAQAQELVELAASRGVVLAVNYIRRYASGHQLARERIAAGALGRIQFVSGLYSGGLVHNGSHWIDHVRWLVGEIASVAGRAVRGANSAASPDVRIAFANGARGSLAGCEAEAFAVFETDIVGTGGRARFTELGHRIEFLEVAESPYYTGYRNLVPMTQEAGGLEHAMVNAVEDLLACVETGRAPRCGGGDGVRALSLAQQAQEQALAHG